MSILPTRCTFSSGSSVPMPIYPTSAFVGFTMVKEGISVTPNIILLGLLLINGDKLDAAPKVMETGSLFYV